jgi:hypothetical protein
MPQAISKVISDADIGGPLGGNIYGFGGPGFAALNEGGGVLA